MKKLSDITENFENLYYPKSALIFYEAKDSETKSYVEHFDMDKNGNLINAHPLTVLESKQLAKSLIVQEDKEQVFLKSKGIISSQILQVDHKSGTVIWYTKAKNRQMYFVENLGIENGKANVPALLWIANGNHLSVLALKNNRRPTQNSILYYAPFLNVYERGNVCMGTVNVSIKNTASLEEFTTAWEDYFFNSYFSHLVGNHNPINGNIVSIWKGLVNTDEVFPIEKLKTCNKTLKQILR